MKLRILFYILAFITAFTPAFSQFALNVKPTSDQSPYNVGIGKLPVMYADIQASDNGNPVKLTKENLIVLERKNELSQISLPSKIDSVIEIAGGWQRIFWDTKTETFDREDQLSNAAILVGAYKGKAASAPLLYFAPQATLLIIKDATNGQNTDRIDFGPYKPNQLNYKQIYIVPLKGIVGGGIETSYYIDSIAFDSPYFTYLWQGTAFERTPPPFKASLASEYLVDLYYNPPDNDFRNAVFTVYFNGGMTRRVYLSAGYSGLEREKVLEVTSPLPGSHFSPCEETLIKWKGHVPSLPSIVEVSFNGGRKWNFIASVIDSQYVWKVPDSVSAQTLIRVYQRYAETEAKDITTVGPSVYSLAFNSTGSVLASASETGYISLWDIKTYSNIRNLGDQAITASMSKGMAFIDGDKKLAAMYNIPDFSGIPTPDTIAIYDVASGSVISKKAFTDYPVKKFKSDAAKRYFALVPSFGARLSILDSKDLSIVKDLIFDMPVVGMDFDDKNDKLIVSLMNGEIEIYDISAFSLSKSYNYDRLPLNLQMAASPNGKLLALGAKAEGSGRYVEHAVLNLETGNLVKYVSVSATDPVALAFSPSSSILAVGSVAQPQIAFMDLTLDNIIATMSGGSGLLTDLKFNPQGSSIATASSNGRIFYRTFTYPEIDTIDGFIVIEKVKPLVEPVIVQDRYIGTSYDQIFDKVICNNDQVPLYIYSVRLKHDKYFHLINPPKEFYLEPGNCVGFNINFNPLDTGALNDTLLVYACGMEFSVPFSGYSMNRNIRFTEAVYDFGEVCIGTGKKIKLKFDNLDPEIFELNYFTSDNKSFFAPNIPNGVKVSQNSGYEAEIEFNPDTLGEIKGNIILYHSGQKNVFFKIPVRGIGIGSFLQVSHRNLYFIPEILERDLEIANTGEKVVTLINPVFSRDSIFEILTPLPIVIQPGASVKVIVKWLGVNFAEPVGLKFVAEPCVTNSDIALGLYSASSNLIVPDITAKSVEEVDIPVSFENIENKSYQGNRFLEFTIISNPRLFLPLSVTSEYGSAVIMSNNIVNDRRIFTVRVEGDFPDKGVGAVIHGVPGLAETDTTMLSISNSSINWGAAVKVNAKDGLLRVDDGSTSRKILKNTATFSIKAISPNPADNLATVEFTSTEEIQYKVKVVDSYGRILLETSEMHCKVGDNSVTLNLFLLPVGSYSVIISGSGAINTYPLIIVR